MAMLMVGLLFVGTTVFTAACDHSSDDDDDVGDDDDDVGDDDDDDDTSAYTGDELLGDWSCDMTWTETLQDGFTERLHEVTDCVLSVSADWSSSLSYTSMMTEDGELYDHSEISATGTATWDGSIPEDEYWQLDFDVYTTVDLDGDNPAGDWDPYSGKCYPAGEGDMLSITCWNLLDWNDNGNADLVAN